MIPKKAIFLDRDGTLNKNKEGYLSQPKDLEWITGALKALKLLQDLGFFLLIVTNQSGIGRGYFSLDHYFNFSHFFHQKLKEEGIIINMTYVCPHDPVAHCICRKPKSALIDRAIVEWHIDRENSYMVGDKESDLMAGRNAGLKVAMVGTSKRDNPLEQFSNILDFADYLKESLQ